MSQQNLCYDLRFEPWIPVERLNGTSDVVSLRDALCEAHCIRRISGEIPGENLALLRLLLALVYCTYYSELEDMSERDKRTKWKELKVLGAFNSDDVEDYLADYPHEFNLFDREHPFYQIPNLTYMGEKQYDPISEFMLDVPKPEKYLFSMRGANQLNLLSFDLAARYLVVTQAFDTAGIKSPVVGNTSAKGGKAYAPKGALGTGWCGALGGIYLEGQNLFETILYNWVLFLNNRSITTSDDYAPWERDVPSPNTCQREPTGPVDLLTWQSRRMRLVPSDDSATVCGVIISYGDVLTPANKQLFEMMTGWRKSKQQQKKLGTNTPPLMPIAPDTARALWRGLPELLSFSQEREMVSPGVISWMQELQDVQSQDDWRFTVRISCQGVSYGTQSSVVDDSITDSIDLRASLVHKNSEDLIKLLSIIENADQAVRFLIQFVQNVEQAQGDKRRSSDSTAQAARENIREEAYSALDELFRRRIASFPEDETASYCFEWRIETRNILRRLAQSYVSRQHLSYFAERDDMSAGKALVWFEQGLTKALF